MSSLATVLVVILTFWVVSHDLDSYADFAMTVIRRLPGIKEMQSMFVLKKLSRWMLTQYHLFSFLN